MQNTENRARRNAILLVTMIASFLTPFMASAVNIALPSIGKEFNLNVIALSWVTTAYLLTSASLLIPFGRLADIYGRKKIFTMGMIVFTIGSILTPMSNSGIMILISRGIQGVGGAAIFSTAMAILTSEFSNEERGKILGINIATVYIGLSMGPFLGGLLTQYMGWRSIFIITSVLNVIVIFIAFWKLKGESGGIVKDKFDIVGSIVYSIALILIMYGVTLLPGTNAIGLIIGGIIIGIVFVWWESRAPKPLLDMGLFRHNRAFAFSNLAALINYSGTYVVAFLLSIYLQYVGGYNSKTAGLIMVTSPAVQAIFSPITGRLSDHIEPRVLSSSGMAISAAGIGYLAFINQDTPVGLIIGCLALLGFGFSLFSSPNTNAVMSSVDRQSYGVASATVSTMRQIGMMLSMGITTIVFNLVIGQVEITPEYYPALTKSAHIIFGICGALCLVGIYPSLARGNIRENTAKTPSGNPTK
ncbi:MAG: MFS transporter [Dehalococcoidales bacterium]|nr:MFS transporter [Dehalococcoidales bacterium]